MPEIATAAFEANRIYFRNNGGGLIVAHADGEVCRLSSVQWQCGLCLEIIDYADAHDELEAAKRHAMKHVAARRSVEKQSYDAGYAQGREDYADD